MEGLAYILWISAAVALASSKLSNVLPWQTSGVRPVPLVLYQDAP